MEEDILSYLPTVIFRGTPCTEAYSRGAIWGVTPPLDQLNLLISVGFQAPTGAKPPLKEKNLSRPWTNS